MFPYMYVCEMILGEILNRFSKDMETVDSSVPEFMLQVLINWAQVFSIFALCISVTPYFILAMLPLGIGFYKMYNYFANASRDLKRLESITRCELRQFFYSPPDLLCSQVAYIQLPLGNAHWSGDDSSVWGYHAIRNGPSIENGAQQ